MRIRTIKPEFWSHPVMTRQHDSVRLLAIAILNIADDEGYFIAEPRQIRSQVWPLTEDSVNAHGALITLSEVGYVEVRKHPTHGMIGWVVNFTKHQRINRPSPSKLKTYFLTEDSLNVHGTLTERSLLEQGTGNREQGTGKGEVARADALVIPDDLKGLKSALLAFISHRKEIRHPIKSTGFSALCAKVRQMRTDGVDVAACINEAIANGWRGLFPDRAQKRAETVDDASERIARELREKR